jgi:PAS domain-containing protein
MTVTQAVHLIEQFAAQAPFAVWITDSRGVAIFANRKLHELLAIPEHPSGALGFNLFDDPSIKTLNLTEMSAKLRAGEVVDTVVDIPRPEDIKTRVDARRKDPLTIRVTSYALRSSAQVIEHYVIMIEDVTETTRQRQELKRQLDDLAIYNKSREARLARLHELDDEVGRLEKEIRARGAEPSAG